MKMRLLSFCTYFCMIVFFGLFAHAENKPPVLVELFTSEGCNSCPPADSLLTELSAHSDIIAIAYHVTYWDYLGWKDKLAREWSNDVQKKYARSLQLTSLYTPQIIIDGRHSEVGSNRNAINHLIAMRQRDQNRLILQIDDLTSHYQVRIDNSTLSSDPGKVNIHAVYYLKPVQNNILSGENRGKLLKHTNVALKQKIIGRWNGKPNAEYRIKKPTDSTLGGVAVFIKTQAKGVVIGSQKLNF